MTGQPTVRPTASADHEAVLALVRAAFSNPDRDGQEEVDIVVETWSLSASTPTIDLVAVHDEMVVGHVLGAQGRLGDSHAIGVAPLAVAPDHQGRGVGKALMHDLLRRAEDANWPAAVLLGNPGYYGRFGFEPAGPLGIVYAPVGADSPYFQVHRLAAYDPSIRGQFTYCWEIPSPS